ncbi:hypothetical protein [Limisalsivibrio acetivorans]|uniref:hypothetical protein n=1 Tax=Limisalsivibrio acetivorans TaxID=1304888 RepID=UPI0003B50BD9|nr:hypothetical protein [Limisalsivibrio acetivorans]
MTGKADQKTGEESYPGILDSLTAALYLCFFNKKALYMLFLNRRHMWNIITIALATLILPYRTPINGTDVFFTFEGFLETVILESIFFGLLFIFARRKSFRYAAGFLRVFLAIYITGFAMPLTLFFSGNMLSILFAFLSAWNLSVIIFAFSTLNGLDYFRGGSVVMLCFMITIMIPAVM